MTAKRDNAGKPKLSLNMESLQVQELEARVWETGLPRYGRGNWLKGRPYTDTVDSLLRHVVKFLAGQDLDLNEKGEVDAKHNGLPHVGMILANAKILAHSYLAHGKVFDDRAAKQEAPAKQETAAPGGQEIATEADVQAELVRRSKVLTQIAKEEAEACQSVDELDEFLSTHRLTRKDAGL